jgi:hypothetical protein
MKKELAVQEVLPKISTTTLKIGHYHFLPILSGSFQHTQLPAHTPVVETMSPNNTLTLTFIPPINRYDHDGLS